MTEPARLFDPDRSPPVEVESPVVRVLPEVSGLDREFDYRSDPARTGPVAVGSLVRVELQHRTVAGWVTAVGTDPPPGVQLQPLVKVSSVGPSADLVALARWAARRWGGRLAPVLRAASPPRMVATLPPSHERPRAGPPVLPPGVTVARVSPDDDLLSWLVPLAAAGSVLVVTPRVDTARHLVGRLRQRGFPARSHPRDWAAAAGRGGVVVGARSAVWARVADLVAVVVVDEHDESLQEERNPTWHARDVAVERARRAGIPCLLLSPCPSLTALAGADAVRVPSRSAERAGWPVVEVIDRRSEEPGRGGGLFSSRVAALVRAPGSVLAVLNRKGRAVMLSCAVCGELARTEDGERLMVEQEGRLVCPATGETRPLVCAVCGGTSLKRLRLGVTRAAEELAALAGEPVAELSATTDKQRLPTRVVVGTEAALHQLGRVDRVVFLDFDQELLAPRFRAGEQAMALLVLAARLVGPRADGGRIAIQTRSPGHRVLRAAVRADPGLLADEERLLRQPMGLPPFGALAEISGPAAADLVAGVADRAEVAVMGPRPDGRYLLRAPDPDTLADVLAPARRPSGRVRVAVDPPRA